MNIVNDMKYLKYFIVSSLLGLVLASSQAEIVRENEENWQDDPELTAGFTEGDMEIDKVTLYNGMTDATKRWPNAVVHYSLDNAFGKKKKNKFILRTNKIYV